VLTYISLSRRSWRRKFHAGRVTVPWKVHTAPDSWRRFRNRCGQAAYRGESHFQHTGL